MKGRRHSAQHTCGTACATVDTQLVRLNFHRYSRTDDKASADACAILAQLP
jgi:hypothetical protein